MHRDTAPEEAHERGFQAGLRLVLPLCPYPRSQAMLRDAWNQGVATAQRQQMQAGYLPANPARAALLAQSGTLS